MKRLLILLIALLFFSSNLHFPLSLAQESELSFAQIESDAILYSKSDSAYTPICSLPSTYFVRLLSEAQNGYYAVAYDDLTGYVAVDKVTVCEGEPITKYHSATLTLSNDGHAINLRSEPTHERDNIVATLPSNSSVHYYGAIVGSAQVDAVGNEWYFIRFDEDGEKKRGFVYSLYATASPIPENIVEFKPVIAPPSNSEESGTTDDAPKETETKNTATTLSPLKEGIIIVALCIPAVLIVYILFKGSPKRA